MLKFTTFKNFHTLNFAQQAQQVAANEKKMCLVIKTCCQFQNSRILLIFGNLFETTMKLPLLFPST